MYRTSPRGRNLGSVLNDFEVGFRIILKFFGDTCVTVKESKKERGDGVGANVCIVKTKTYCCGAHPRVSTLLQNNANPFNQSALYN